MEVELSNGYRGKIDKISLPIFLKFKWYRTAIGYAATRPWDKVKKTYSTLLLHRVLMNSPKGKCVDHINGDTLDNRLKNLRICTHKENIRNSNKLRSNNKSGYRGVFWCNQKQRWAARIKVDYKSIHLGFFKKAEDASNAYLKAAKNYFGKFASIQ